MSTRASKVGPPKVVAPKVVAPKVVAPKGGASKGSAPKVQKPLDKALEQNRLEQNRLEQNLVDTTTKFLAYVRSLKTLVPFLADGYPYDGVDCAKFAGEAVSLTDVQIKAARGEYGVSMEQFLADVRQPFVRSLQWYTGSAYTQFRFSVRAALTTIAKELSLTTLLPGFMRCRAVLDTVYMRDEVVARMFSFDPQLYPGYDHSKGMGVHEMWLGEVTTKLERLEYKSIAEFCDDLKLVGVNYEMRHTDGPPNVRNYAHFIICMAQSLLDFPYPVYIDNKPGVGGGKSVPFRVLRGKSVLDRSGWRNKPHTEMYRMMAIDPASSPVWASIPTAEVGTPFARFIVNRVQEFVSSDEVRNHMHNKEMVQTLWTAFNAQKAEELKKTFYEVRASKGGGVVGGKGVHHAALQKSLAEIALVNSTAFIDFWGKYPTFDKAVVQAAYIASLQNDWIPGAQAQVFNYTSLHPGEFDDETQRENYETLLQEIKATADAEREEILASKATWDAVLAADADVTKRERKAIKNAEVFVKDHLDASVGDSSVGNVGNVGDVGDTANADGTEVTAEQEMWERFRSWVSAGRDGDSDNVERARRAMRDEEELRTARAAELAGVPLVEYTRMLQKAARVRAELGRKVRYACLQTVDREEVANFVIC